MNATNAIIAAINECHTEQITTIKFFAAIISISLESTAIPNKYLLCRALILHNARNIPLWLSCASSIRQSNFISAAHELRERVKKYNEGKAKRGIASGLAGRGEGGGIERKRMARSTKCSLDFLFAIKLMAFHLV